MKQSIALILTFFLSACTSFSQAPPFYPDKAINHYLPWAARKAQLNTLQNWSACGNLAIHSSSGSGINASFNWQQVKTHYQLHLFGPLGTQSLLLYGHPDQVTLLTHHQTYKAQNAEQLLTQQLGLRLPVSQLYYWLRGLPAPQSRYTVTLDAYNRLLRLRQAGWRINYLHYTNSDKIDIPDRLLLTNLQWKVQILITHWDFNH
jgi:outer membrane lipoprotein LolB